jgi:hypothetical protein
MNNIHKQRVKQRVADLPPAILLTARGDQAVSAFEPEVILELGAVRYSARAV